MQFGEFSFFVHSFNLSTKYSFCYLQKPSKITSGKVRYDSNFLFRQGIDAQQDKKQQLNF